MDKRARATRAAPLRLPTDAHARVRWVARLVAIGFIMALVATPRLWLTTRLYPLTPVTDALPAFQPPWDAVAYACLIAANVAVLFVPRRTTILVAVLLYLAYSLWDQQRWIPFFNEMAALYLALALQPRARSAAERDRNALVTCGAVIALIYVWSGLQKLNFIFVTETFAWMMAPFMTFVPAALATHLGAIALAVAVLEILLGISLLTRSARRIGIVIGFLMHTFILLSAGPLGNNGNIQIWGWNVIAPPLLVLVFGDATLPEIVSLRRSAVHTAILIFFGVMPLFNFLVIAPFGKWDDFQAATLYSGNESQATIYVAREQLARVPVRLRDLIWQSEEDGRLFIVVKEWAYDELAVPDYHAERIYQSVMRRLCREVGYAPGFVMETGSKADPLTGVRRTRTYVCSATNGIETPSNRSPTATNG